MTPRQLDHYELIELLAEGGSGEVYRARDTRMRREVAIKILSPQALRDPKDAARFEREVRLAAALRHPNVLTVYDCSPPGSSRCYLVTELASGGSLRAYVGQPLLAEEIALLLLPVARALEAAHARGIVHRDVKPDNVLLDRRERLLAVKLMDFGVALGLDEPRITTDGSVSGSIAYMAPEQLAKGVVTPASDTWSLGLTFFELLKGKHPFGERQVRPLVNQVLTQEPRLCAEDAPPHFVAFVHGCLERERERRCPDGASAAAALERALAASGIERPDEELQAWARDPGYRAALAARRQEALARAAGFGLPAAPSSARGPESAARHRTARVRLPRAWLGALAALALALAVALAVWLSR